MGFPGGTVTKNLSAKARDVDRFNPWVRKILQSREWQPAPVFLAWKIPWTAEPGGLHPMGRRESDTTKQLNTTHGSHYLLSKPSCWSVPALDFHRNSNPTVNCACKGSRLPPPYENLMSDDPTWSWGGGANAGEWLWIQIIIRREAWLHRDSDESVACRRIWKLSKGQLMVSSIIISLSITM